MNGETMLRVANVGDDMGIDYEHACSEPDEDRYPQAAYFYVPDDSADDVERTLETLSREHGFDAEVL